MAVLRTRLLFCEGAAGPIESKRRLLLLLLLLLLFLLLKV
jgi:hypothetical protein